VLAHVFRTAAEFSKSRTWEDDATMVVVRRAPTP
jgi:hypothetical protein